jgi:hypothetical protein
MLLWQEPVGSKHLDTLCYRRNPPKLNQSRCPGRDPIRAMQNDASAKPENIIFAIPSKCKRNKSVATVRMEHRNLDAFSPFELKLQE